MSIRWIALTATASAALTWIIPAANAQTLGEACPNLIYAAEQRYNIPNGLLMAIALTESGDRSGGPNPHAMNIGGTPYIAPDLERMVSVIQRGYAAGKISIDVGCLQINLKYHAQHFRSPFDLLNSRVNVDYGARYLAQLANDTGSWRDAVMTYHNRNNPARRAWYGCSVWNNYLRVHRSGQGYIQCGKVSGSSTAATSQPVPSSAPVAVQQNHFRGAGPLNPDPVTINHPLQIQSEEQPAPEPDTAVDEPEPVAKPTPKPKKQRPSGLEPIRRRPGDQIQSSPNSVDNNPSDTDIPQQDGSNADSFGRVTRRPPQN